MVEIGDEFRLAHLGYFSPTNQWASNTYYCNYCKSDACEILGSKDSDNWL